MLTAIKTFTWTDTLETIHISATFPLLSLSTLDIYSNDAYVKVSCGAFILELDLLYRIDPESVNSCATVDGKTVNLTLVKSESGMWGGLVCERMEFKDMKVRRDEAMRRSHERGEERRVKGRGEKAEHQRYLVQSQLDIEQKQRSDIQRAKEEDKNNAKVSINEWNQPDNLSAVQANEQDDTLLAPAAESANEIFDNSCVASTVAVELLELDMDDDCEAGIDMEALRLSVKAQLKINKPVPPPRQSATIQIKFTARGQLPTTVARESEDIKWHARIREMKATAKDVSIVGDNAEELKAKGDSFFGRMNYASAVSAYSEALRVNKSFISNRSASHFELKNYQLCIDDCDYAQSLVENIEEVSKEEVEFYGNGVAESLKRKKMLSKLCFRRGRSLLMQMSLGCETNAMKEYTQALRHDPANEQIKLEVERLQAVV